MKFNKVAAFAALFLATVFSQGWATENDNTQSRWKLGFRTGFGLSQNTSHADESDNAPSDPDEYYQWLQKHRIQQEFEDSGISTFLYGEGDFSIFPLISLHPALGLKYRHGFGYEVVCAEGSSDCGKSEEYTNIFAMLDVSVSTLIRFHITRGYFVEGGALFEFPILAKNYEGDLEQWHDTRGLNFVDISLELRTGYTFACGLEVDVEFAWQLNELFDKEKAYRYDAQGASLMQLQIGIAYWL